MKRWIAWLGLLLMSTCPAWADGFIIVHDFPGQRPMPPVRPAPPRPPVSPPYWLPPPPPRVYPFAPLEVTFHHVTVKIQDQVAVTKVDQEFYNPNDRQLEGTYIFPVPKGAQVDKFTMEIGGRMVEAELLAADKARKIYEDIVRQMKDPALLEYAGREVFKVRIFPIEPHSRKHVKLSYTQVLKADSGLVNYLYPLNTEKFSAKPLREISLKIELESRRPLKSIYSPTHKVEVSRHGERQATVGFESKDIRPDTDFQLVYSLEEGEVGLNLLTYKTSEDDGFFLLLVAPGFEAGQEKVLPKDVAFVLDTSGSMAGSKIEQAQKALQFCINSLNENDRFEIVRFSTETEPLFDRLAPADRDHKRQAETFVKKLKASGGTAIDEALRKALAIRPKDSERPYLVVFLTDGRPTVGETDEDRIVAPVTPRPESRDGSSLARIFCFGLGNDVNTHLLDKITEATQAYSQYVLPEEDLEVKVSNFYAKINEPVLTNLKLTFPETIRATRMYPAPLPDLFKGEQLILTGRYSGRGEGKITLQGSANGDLKRFAEIAQFPSRAEEFEYIPRLWATRRIGYLLDEIRLRGESREVKDEVTELARRYGVVTPYTSYLIMEDESQRRVPMEMRSLSSLDQNRELRRQYSTAWRDMGQQKVGDQANAAARYGLAMKSAEQSSTAITQGNQEVARGYAPATLPAPGASGGANIASRPAGRLAVPVPAPVAPAASPVQLLNGKTFYQNHNQWTDTEIQKHPQAKRVRIQFSSPEYFDLIARRSEALPWLAQGNNVQFVLGDTIYDIFDPETAN